MTDEDERAARLLDAQANAIALFDEVAARGLVAAGQRERPTLRNLHDAFQKRAQRLLRSAIGKIRRRMSAGIRCLQADSLHIGSVEPGQHGSLA